MSTHTIRLAGPWEQTAVAAQLERVPIRCQLPALISTGDTELLLARAFHRPTRLTPETRVDVVISTSNADIVVRLNDTSLIGRSESDVTRFSTGDCLREFNRLEIAVKRSSGDPQLEAGLIHVCLEIIEPSV